MHASYLLFLMVGVGSISIVNASAQASTPLRAEQPEQDVQEQSSSEKNSSAGERSLHGTVKPTDPRARLEADRRDRGMPAAAFKRHLLQQRQEQMTREPDAVAAFATTSAPVWVPIGPTGADYEQNGPGTGYVRDSGRVRTILPHPTDANTVYLLTSGGGLWVTQNFTAALPAWRALTDSQVTTGGGSVAFGRTPSVIYCRTSTPICMPLRNPLAGRSAYTGISVKYPNFTSVTVNLGTAYAGKNVQIRFRVGTDKAARECCFDD